MNPKPTLYVALLKFSKNAEGAPEFMAAHDAWIKEGLEAGVFLVVGTLQPRLGGAILARGIERAALDSMIQRDPFVEHGIVTAEVLELSPAKVDPRLTFLLACG